MLQAKAYFTNDSLLRETGGKISMNKPKKRSFVESPWLTIKILLMWTNEFLF